jgi:hypothetical protein
MPEEWQKLYAQHILYLGDKVQKWSARVVNVWAEAIEIVEYPIPSEYPEQYLRWPGCDYKIGDTVMIVIPPDDYAVAIPMDRAKWPKAEQSNVSTAAGSLHSLQCQ